MTGAQQKQLITAYTYLEVHEIGNGNDMLWRACKLTVQAYSLYGWKEVQWTRPWRGRVEAPPKYAVGLALRKAQPRKTCLVYSITAPKLTFIKCSEGAKKALQARLHAMDCARQSAFHASRDTAATWSDLNPGKPADLQHAFAETLRPKRKISRSRRL